jgi:hypothetical protein
LHRIESGLLKPSVGAEFEFLARDDLIRRA